jgi:glycine/D-amino acid oxidase-like deaminating enzyme
VVVVGAGALGLSTALGCALAGRSVAVVEHRAAGSQASGRAAGLFKSVQADELPCRSPALTVHYPARQPRSPLAGRAQPVLYRQAAAGRWQPSRGRQHFAHHCDPVADGSADTGVPPA